MSSEPTPAEPMPAEPTRTPPAAQAPRYMYLHGDGHSTFAVYHPAGEVSRRRAVLLCPPFGWEDMCSYRSRRDWAEALASAGFAALRFDLPGSGDSAGEPTDAGCLEAWTHATDTAARWLAQASGASHVVAVGIGLGGLVACRAALRGAPIDELALWHVPARGRALVRELRAFAALEVAYIPDANDGSSAPEPQPLEDGALLANGYLMSAETTTQLEALDLTRMFAPSRDEPAASAGEQATDAEHATGAAGTEHATSATSANRPIPLRTLLLGRDGLKVDERLRQVLEQAGTTVSVADGPGYATMMLEPQEASPPLEVFALVQAWLEQGEDGDDTSRDDTSGDDTSRNDAGGEETNAPTRPGTGVERRHEANVQRAPIVTDGELRLTYADSELREQVLAIEGPDGPVLGILTEPLGGHVEMCALLINAGAQRRTGPNRMWVQIARRWAARGVPTLRFDLSGIGDSDGDAAALVLVASIYKAAYGLEARAALDALAARGLPQRFVVLGLCAGGYWSLQTALADERVRAAILLNPRSLIWDEGIYGARRVRELRERLFLVSTWRKALRGELTLARHLETARALARRAARGSSTVRARLGATEQSESLDRTTALAGIFDSLGERDQRALLLFTGAEPLHRELASRGLLAQAERWPSVRFVIRGTSADTHTLTPLWLQRQVHELVDGVLEQELARVPAGARS